MKHAIEVSPHWRRTLWVVWMTQYLSILGFSFAMPFAPYYMQELGVQDPDRLKLWVALFAAAAPVTMAVSSPVWGILADRYGRKLMLLRANLGGVLVMLLMSMAPNVQTLIVLRLMQGLLTGTMTAAQAMVSSQTPGHRSGMALGMLSAAVFSGSMSGAFVGGFVAELLGYRAAFVGAAIFLLAGFLLVLFGTSERPLPSDLKPGEDDADSLPRGIRGKLTPVLPLLLLIVLIGMVRHFDTAWLPLLVQHIHGRLAGASARTGTITAVAGIAGFLGGPIIGRFADRFSPARMGMLSALCAAVMMLAQAVAPTLALLALARFGVIIFAGGLDPVLHIWLSKRTERRHHGFMFGWASTARSIGWIGAPLLSGLVAWASGLRAVFVASALLYLLLVVCIHGVRKRLA